MTVVRPDTTLAMGVVQGTKATLYSTGHKLGYTPKAIAFLGNTKSTRGETRTSADSSWRSTPPGGCTASSPRSAPPPPGPGPTCATP